MKSPDWEQARQQMVDEQVVGRGIKSPLVIEAMRSVPREVFVPDALRKHAYEDGPLPIGHEQTISQPYIVAYMIEALDLRGGEKLLEIGAGSGYAAAVMAQIAADVFTIERIEPLARAARNRLQSAGYENIRVKCGDGTLGWRPEQAPFDGIIVAAAAPVVPPALKAQLKVGGRLVIPVGANSNTQGLTRIVRLDIDEYRVEDLGGVRFVPLIGDTARETD